MVGINFGEYFPSKYSPSSRKKKTKTDRESSSSKSPKFEQVCDEPDYSTYFSKLSVTLSRTQPNTPNSSNAQITPKKRLSDKEIDKITPFMKLPLNSKDKENFVVGSTWNLVISSMVLSAKFNHDEYEYDKNFAKFFSAKLNQATITTLMHQYLSLV